MQTPLLGLHHITAIVNDPQENVDFYSQVLGLRLVKQTVNFDDPYTYHLYFGDNNANPGTIMTFFIWPDAVPTSHGSDEISSLAFRVPQGAFSFWQEHLSFHQWRFSDPEERFGHQVMMFYDPAGLLIELVEEPITDPKGSFDEIVPAHAAIQGLYGVTLTVRNAQASASFLEQQLGLQLLGSEGNQTRYLFEQEGETAAVTLVERPELSRGRQGSGTIHHLAWRVNDRAALEAWQEQLRALGLNVTPVRDRFYFESIYFREANGILFEFATDGPGFTRNEALDELGSSLVLPPWFEPQRDQIERRLPPFQAPTSKQEASKQVRKVTEMPTPNLSFIHQYVAPQSPDAPTLLLLHGTGGNEHDLLAIGKMIHPQAGLLSPRGQVLEHGMPRFFRRLAEGVFDLDDLRRRTEDMANFVSSASKAYNFDPSKVIAVGYSNGANIAASLMLLRPTILAGAILFHAMVPLVPDHLPDLGRVPVFMGAGEYDALIPRRETERLATLLQQAGAVVELFWQPSGHGLNQNEIDAATNWLSHVQRVAPNQI